MPHCIGYGEVEIVERGHALSKVKLESGVEVEVPTSYLPAEEESKPAPKAKKK